MRRIFFLLLTAMCVAVSSCGVEETHKENGSENAMISEAAGDTAEESSAELSCGNSYTDSVDTWEIVMSAENVSNCGMTLKINTRNESLVGELGTGSEYVLERLNGGEWEKVVYARKSDVCWDSVLYLITKDKGYSEDIRWTHIYGVLGTGTYRICKDILYTEPGKAHKTQRYYLEFTVGHASEDSCPYALMHDGVMYYHTGEYIFEKVEYLQEDILGKVTSVIPESKMPSEDGQANIPIEGSIYMRHELSGDGLLVLINDKWYIFERRDGDSDDSAKEENSFAESDASVDMIKLPMTEPPALTISHGNESVTAMRGSYSWIYTDGNGEEVGICADGLHPLKAKEYMPTLYVKPQIFSRVSPKTVYLDFELEPSEVFVRACRIEYYGHAEQEIIPVDVNRVEVDFADGGYDSYSEIEISDGEYVYDIIAKWENKEKDGFEGTAYYAFIAEPSIPAIIEDFISEIN